MLQVLCLLLWIAPAEAPGYPDVPLARLSQAPPNEWDRPRARTVGKVTLVRHEADGDWHCRLEGADAAGKAVFIVLEIIPELPLPRPAVGDVIEAWGIVRWDGHGGHGWMELHPLIGWRKH